MNRSTRLRAIVTLALALALVLGTVPAYGSSVPAAAETGPVPSHALIGGVDLYNLPPEVAVAVISSGSVLPTLPAIKVTGDGHSITVVPTSAVSVNAIAMLYQAYIATDTVTPFELTPVYSISWSVVSGWTSKLAGKADHDAVDSKRSVRRSKLYVSASRVGHKVNRGTTTSLIKSAIASEIASPGLTGVVVNASLRTIKPKITRANIGKAILVRLSKFTITLYKNTKVEKRYRCAVGMSAYPTPKGKFKVTGKVKWPVWHNPGSAWASNMPATIGRGLNNPLGTRAIYLSAPGIRMHGIPASKNWSIGHRASHGCLRMVRRDVEDFYPRVPVGIPVWIIK